MVNEVWLPAAIRFGIDYKDFWGLNPKILKLYQARYEEQIDVMHMEGWIHGQYMLAAIETALDSKKNPYPKEPFMCVGKEESAFNPDEQAAIEFGAWAKAIGTNLRSKEQEVEQNV